jgi:hypothetical protein
MNRLTTVAAIVLGLLLASLPFVHYRFAAPHHAPHPQQGGFHAHHAH